MTQHTPGPTSSSKASLEKARATPGPWEATTGIGPLSHYVVHRSNDGKRHKSYMVCAVGETPVAEANARLIAAAPEMLVFLQDYGGPGAILRPDNEALIQRARALLARIEGKE